MSISQPWELLLGAFPVIGRPGQPGGCLLGRRWTSSGQWCQASPLGRPRSHLGRRPPWAPRQAGADEWRARPAWTPARWPWSALGMQPGVQSPSGTGPGGHDARLPPGLPAAPPRDVADRPRGLVAAWDLHDAAGSAL